LRVLAATAHVREFCQGVRYMLGNGALPRLLRAYHTVNVVIVQAILRLRRQPLRARAYVGQWQQSVPLLTFR